MLLNLIDFCFSLLLDCFFVCIFIFMCFSLVYSLLYWVVCFLFVCVCLSCSIAFDSFVNKPLFECLLLFLELCRWFCLSSFQTYGTAWYSFQDFQGQTKTFITKRWTIKNVHEAAIANQKKRKQTGKYSKDVLNHHWQDPLGQKSAITSHQSTRNSARRQSISHSKATKESFNNLRNKRNN